MSTPAFSRFPPISPFGKAAGVASSGRHEKKKVFDDLSRRALEAR